MRPRSSSVISWPACCSLKILATARPSPSSAQIASTMPATQCTPESVPPVPQEPTRRMHTQLQRPDRDLVVIVVAEVGGVQDAGLGSRSGPVELDPGTDLDVLRPDGDGPARAVVTPSDDNALAELRRRQDRVAVRPGGDGTGEEVAMADELGHEPRAGLP